jgi:hypothetical protein
MTGQKEKNQEEPQVKKGSYLEKLLKRIRVDYCYDEEEEDTELNEN